MWKNRLWRRREVSLAPSITRTPAVPSVAVRRTRETRLKLFAIREITRRGISSETVPRVWPLTSTIKHSQPRQNNVLRGGLKDLSVEHTVEYPSNSEPASGRLPSIHHQQLTAVLCHAGDRPTLQDQEQTPLVGQLGGGSLGSDFGGRERLRNPSMSSRGQTCSQTCSRSSSSLIAPWTTAARNTARTLSSTLC